MKAILERLAAATIAAFTLAAGMMWNGEIYPSTVSDLTSSAQARVGRPLTPVSYAGVARRTTRRAVYSGAVYAPAPVVVAPPPACVTVVDSYGRTVSRCQ